MKAVKLSLLLGCALLGAFLLNAVHQGDAAPVVEAPPLRSPSLMAVHQAAEPEVSAPPAPVAAAPPNPTAVPPPLFPFRFLGRVGEGAVVLFGNGRTFTVRAPGPLDADYAVDEIREGELVLRHVRLNATRVLAFVSLATAPATTKRVEDYPQD